MEKEDIVEMIGKILTVWDQEDLLALRWRENLKLCAIQWDYMRRKNKEEDT